MSQSIIYLYRTLTNPRTIEYVSARSNDISHKMDLELILAALFSLTESIKVFRSTIEIPQETVSGIHFRNTDKVRTQNNSFTSCIRLNYGRFSPHKEAMIFNFDFSNHTFQTTRPFLWVPATYPATWLGLGVPEKENHYSNWILMELPDNYNVWITNAWHHFCLSFSKIRSSISVVKVCKPIHK